MEDFVHKAPLAVIGSALLVAMILARELGGLARRLLARRSAGAEGKGGDEGQILAAVLGLLALLIAFTFSLALDHHEQRAGLVVTEANALGTAYLRTDLLENPQPLRDSLRAYTRERLVFGLSDGEAQNAAEQRGAALRDRIWTEATAAVRPYLTTDLAPMVLDPINTAFDAAEARRNALMRRLPTSVLASLGLYVVASAAVLGYALARAQEQHRTAGVVMFALVVLAIHLILDLDRPRSGAIRIPQTTMADTLAAMK